MSSNDADLLLKNFKQKIEKIESLKLNIGIPKEYKAHAGVSKSRSKRQEKIETEMFLEETSKSIKRGDKTLPKFKGLESKKEEYIADIAFKNNFGSFKENIPPRPFGSTLMPRYKDKFNKVMQKEFKEYLEGKKSLLNTFNRIGLSGQKYMQDNLKNGNWKPNSPLTIALKGSSVPLIDTGQMRLSITYIVEDLNRK